MKRLIGILALTLAGCGTRVPATPIARPTPALHTHGYAYADLQRIAHADPAYAAVLEYDRQIATLQAVSFPHVTIDAGAALRNAARAAGTVAAATKAADQTDATRMLDPATLSAAMRESYARQAALVRAHSGSSSAAYYRALQQEQGDTISSFAHALELRADRAFANRSQELREREANDQLDRERVVANRRLLLSLKLRNLRPDARERRILQAELDEIDRSLAQAFSAERNRDATTLAAYRVVLQEHAVVAFDAATATIRDDANTNWQTRRRIADAQGTQSGVLPLRTMPDEAPPDAATTAATTAAILQAGAGDIARAVDADIRADAADHAGAAGAIAALRAQRNALYTSIVANVRMRAERVAAARGLRLIDAPRTGAVDITEAARRTGPGNT